MLLIAISVVIGIGLLAQERGLRRGTAQAADKFDLVISAPGSELSVMMATVFLQPTDMPLLDGDTYAAIATHENVEIAAPIAFGDSFGNASVIGTTEDFARYLADPALPPDTEVERPTTVTNIVLMGMGEPLHNYANVWTALRRLTDADAFGLGARHITLSTVGLAPMIDRMADEGLQIGLAVSLHAPNDELRTKLVPVNKGYPVDDVLAAVRRYVAKTNRRVTFEYALMAGINDSPELAHELAEKLQGILCHVNLIPLNPIPDSPFQPSSDEDTEGFAQILRDAGIPATVRLRRGIEINAGCGQLRRAAKSSVR